MKAVPYLKNLPVGVLAIAIGLSLILLANLVSGALFIWNFHMRAIEDMSFITGMENVLALVLFILLSLGLSSLIKLERSAKEMIGWYCIMTWLNYLGMVSERPTHAWLVFIPILLTFSYLYLRKLDQLGILKETLPSKSIST